MAPIRYQLSIHAERVPCGWFGKPSTYAEVKVTGGPREGTTLGRTETVEKSLNPVWVKKLYFDTESSEYLPLKITIFHDRDIGYDDIKLAEATFEATEVHQSAGHADSVKCGRRTIIGASVEESIKGDARGDCTLHLRGLDIKNVEPGFLGLGRSDPFFELSRKIADHSTGYVRWNVIYRSEHIHDHLNPYWKPFTYSLEALCQGNLDSPLKITVFDHQLSGKHREIGSFETTLRLLTGRISKMGNADREQAFKIFSDEEGTQNNAVDESKNKGLVCVLKADIKQAT